MTHARAERHRLGLNPTLPKPRVPSRAEVIFKRSLRTLAEHWYDVAIYAIVILGACGLIWVYLSLSSKQDAILRTHPRVVHPMVAHAEHTVGSVNTYSEDADFSAYSGKTVQNIHHFSGGGRDRWSGNNVIITFTDGTVLVFHGNKYVIDVYQ